MQLRYLCLLLLLMLGVSACGMEEDQPHSPAEGYEGEFFSEDFILTYFLEADESLITLNISEARAEYLMEVEGASGVDDMMYTVQVERSEELEIVDTNEEPAAVEDIHEGDKVYVAYDIQDYMADDAQAFAEIETDRLIIEEVTPEEMIQRFVPAQENAYYIGIVHREGEDWGGYDEFDLEHLLEYGSFGSIVHQDGVPAYDYIEVFDIEDGLPIFFIIGQDGLGYKTYDLEAVEDFLEASASEFVSLIGIWNR